MREDFLPWYNEKYTYKVEESVYRTLKREKNLDLVFSLKYPKKVNKDTTLRCDGRMFQLIPRGGMRSLSGKWVEVCELLNGDIKILYEDKEISFLELKREEYKNMKEKEIMSRGVIIQKKSKKKRISPLDHPWIRGLSKAKFSKLM